MGEFYSGIANQIGVAAGNDGFSNLAGMLPMGILFGAARTLTPGDGMANLAA